MIMMYADFEYYVENFKGCKTPQEEFGGYMKKASDYIDGITLCKALSQKDDARVKDCACALCDFYFEYDNEGKYSSASVDGVSVTLADKKTSKSDGAFSIILLYLASTGLLYRGMGK
nr:MAG TPA: Head Tail Connector Protein [Caudoviricetes sp.]